MKPWKTLKDLLVHPKDKQDKGDITECVYKVPCANCDKTYVGETGRNLGVRLHEHKTEVESKTRRAFTRSQRTASLTAYSKSALTDHANQANHTSTGKRLRSSTENKTVLLGGSRKPYISARKVIELWIETRAVISWVTPTNAFLMRQLIVASRLGRTSFFWWRSRDDIETSKWDIKVLVVIYEFSTSKSIHSFAFLALFSNKWLHIRPTVLR